MSEAIQIDADLDIRAEVEDVGPDEARTLLGNERLNRNPSRQYIDRLAGAMERGEWRVNGESLKTDQEDRMFDGKQRCEAVIRSNVPIRTLVVRGLDPKSVETVDMGRRRTLQDILTLHEEHSANRLSSGLIFLWRFRNDKLTTRGKGGRVYPTPQQALELLEAEPEIRDGIILCDRVYRYMRLQPSVGIAMLQAFNKVDHEQAYRFFSTLADDRDLPSNDPRAMFRRQIEQEWADLAKYHTRPWRERQAAWMVKAFNDWRKGNTVERPYRWVPGGDTGEAFPHPV